jgi:hypothetical protein
VPKPSPINRLIGIGNSQQFIGPCSFREGPFHHGAKTTLTYTVVWGQGQQKNNSKNKNRNFEEIIFSKKVFLHGEKENFEEYSLF